MINAILFTINAILSLTSAILSSEKVVFLNIGCFVFFN